MAAYDHSREPVMAGAASLALDAVSKSFGTTVAVDQVTLHVPPGSMLGLLGPSGCGKTTVLRMIAGLLPATSGTIGIDGQDVTETPPHRRDIGFVFQHYALFPHLTVAGNVAFGLEMRGVPPASARERVAEALSLVRLPDLGSRRPQELSGGQQQRVALARALVIRPRVLLLDEPLSNLDARLRDELRGEIRDIQQRLGITTVFVTHDQAEALSMCDTVGVMSRGRLVQVGAPQAVYDRPASRLVAEFVGKVNLLPCEIVAPGRVRLGTDVVDAADAGEPVGPATAAIRPHRIALVEATTEVGPGEHAVRGTIARVAFVGDIVHYDVSIGALTLAVQAQAARATVERRVGDAVVCRWAADDLRVFRD